MQGAPSIGLGVAVAAALRSPVAVVAMMMAPVVMVPVVVPPVMMAPAREVADAARAVIGPDHPATVRIIIVGRRVVEAPEVMPVMEKVRPEVGVAISAMAEATVAITAAVEDRACAKAAAVEYGATASESTAMKRRAAASKTTAAVETAAVATAMTATMSAANLGR